MFGNAVFGLGGPIAAVGGGENKACWGDSTKHSSRDIKDVVADDVPFPNLNGGSNPADLMETALVECPLVRGKEGRSMVGLLRL